MILKVVVKKKETNMLDVILASVIGAILLVALRSRLRKLRKGHCMGCEGGCESCMGDGRKKSPD